MLVLFALLAVTAYFFAGRKLPPGPVREAAWIVAFAQGLLALVAVAIPVTSSSPLIAVVVLLVLLMRLLGERSRGYASGLRLVDWRAGGAWPSGKATGFGPVIPGSNPGAPV